MYCIKTEWSEIFRDADYIIRWIIPFFNFHFYQSSSVASSLNISRITRPPESHTESREAPRCSEIQTPASALRRHSSPDGSCTSVVWPHIFFASRYTPSSCHSGCNLPSVLSSPAKRVDRRKRRRQRKSICRQSHPDVGNVYECVASLLPFPSLLGLFIMIWLGTVMNFWTSWARKAHSVEIFTRQQRPTFSGWWTDSTKEMAPIFSHKNAYGSNSRSDFHVPYALLHRRLHGSFYKYLSNWTLIN